MREGLNEPAPQNGDIVIVHYPTSPIRWMVRQVPDAPQCGASSKVQVLQLARGYAQAHVLDLWCNDGGRVRLLERYRPAPIARPTPQKSWGRA